MTPKQRVQEWFPLAFCRWAIDGTWVVVVPLEGVLYEAGFGKNATSAWRDAANKINKRVGAK